MNSPCNTCDKLIGDKCCYSHGWRERERFRGWFRMRWRVLQRIWKEITNETN